MISNLLIKIKEFDAHGGPSVKTMGADRNEMTPTESGRFVIAKIEKHVSSGRYLWSGIPWGAGLKFINNVTYIDISNKGLWQKLTVYRPIWIKEFQTEEAVTKAIMDYWKLIAFTTYAGNSISLYGMQTPDKWVFNDFGHISVKYFRDTNHNGILDKNETILGDFIHTIPGDEAISSYNSTRQANQTKFAVDLPGSHGCIHVKPDDVDTMIGAGYLKQGQVIVVHTYREMVIPNTIKPDKHTRKGYEAHFFPGLFKIAIYKVN